MPFQICEFEDGIQGVPLNWIEGDICKYPPYISQIKINKAISTEEEPGDNWIKHKILRKFGHTIEKYTTAVEKTKLAQKFSDIDDTEDEGVPSKKRKERAAKNLDLEFDDFTFTKMKKVDGGKTLPKLPVVPRKSPRKLLAELIKTPEKIRKSPRKPIEPIGTTTTPTFTTQTADFPVTSTQAPSTSKSKTPKTTEKDFNSDVMRKINLIFYKLKQIDTKIDELLEGKKANLAQPLVTNAIGEEIFPLKTVDGVKDFERLCREDIQYTQKCVTSLKSLGGNSIIDLTARVLKRVMSNELADQYSLLGRKKNGFKPLALYRVLFLTVQHHFKDLTEKDLDPIVARWLVQAKLRISRINKSRDAEAVEASELLI